MGGVVTRDHDVIEIMLHPDVLQHLENKVNILFIIIHYKCQRFL